MSTPPWGQAYPFQPIQLGQQNANPYGVSFGAGSLQQNGPQNQPLHGQPQPQSEGSALGYPGSPYGGVNQAGMTQPPTKFGWS